MSVPYHVRSICTECGNCVWVREDCDDPKGATCPSCWVGLNRHADLDTVSARLLQKMQDETQERRGRHRARY